jgi:hypothetical protein
MSDDTADTLALRRRFGRRWLMIGLTIAYVDRARLNIAIPFIQHEYGFDQVWKGFILVKIEPLPILAARQKV